MSSIVVSVETKLLSNPKFIILRSKVYQESDLILDVLSKQGEKFTVTAKNAVQSRKRFAGGVLEPLNYVELHLSESRQHRFYVQEARCLNSFPGLRKDYDRLSQAFLLLKFINKLSQEGLGDTPQLFDLLGNTLNSLQASQDPQLLALHFQIKCLYHLGFLPHNDDFAEFVATPVAHHQSLILSDEEFNHLKKLTEYQVRELGFKL